MNKSLATVKIDKEKINKIINSNGMTANEFNNSVGHSEGWIRKVFKRGTMAPSDVMLIKVVYGVDITLKEEEKKEPISVADNTDSKDMRAIDFTDIITVLKETDKSTEIISKLDELNKNVIRLGNVNMQILEALNKTNNHILRRPQAYTIK